MEIYKVGSNFGVRGTSKVIVKNALKFRRGKKVVGALDAVYDFKDLPVELHSLAIQCIPKPLSIAMPR
jgi:hypothetical protein